MENRVGEGKQNRKYNKQPPVKMSLPLLSFLNKKKKGFNNFIKANIKFIQVRRNVSSWRLVRSLMKKKKLTKQFEQEGNENHLNDDLIAQILSWLPVKSLMRFKCVNKSWKSLIHHPSFVKLHLQRSPKHTSILLMVEQYREDRGDPIRSFPSRFFALPYYVNSLLDNLLFTTFGDYDSYRLNSSHVVVGSCNGLVCLRSSSYDEKIEYHWIHFWNPATRLKSERLMTLCVKWQRVVGTVCFGVGYDDLSDTYKVLALLSDSQETTLKVHAVGDNCWRNILTMPFLPLLRENVEFLSGTNYWLAHHDSGSGTIAPNQLAISALDLGTETYRQLLLPDGLDELYSHKPRLGVLRDSLCVFHDYKETHFIVWQMKEFEGEQLWTQLVNVSYRRIQLSSYTHVAYPLLPLCTSENGDVVNLANIGYSEAILYNRRDNSAQRTLLYMKFVSDVKDYVQSLVWPIPITCCSNVKDYIQN